MKRKIFISIAALLFAFSFFLRFYNLGSIPLGLNKDETAIGYNAYSILKTGKDEYGVRMPLYFKSYNDYKLPVYIYMTSISEHFFGLTPIAVRLPSAIFGVISIVSLFFFIKLLSQRLDLAIASSLLLSFNPWHFFFSRTAFEVNVATSLALLGSLFFVLTVKKRGNIILLLLTIVSFGLSLYSYNVARIMSPLLFAGLLFLYRAKIKTWSRRNIAFGIAVQIAILLPFLITLLGSSGLNNQTDGVFLTGSSVKAHQTEIRSYFINLPSFFTKLFFNSGVQYIWQYLINIIRSFSVDFYFINGPKGVNGVANFGMFYLFELITIGVGMYTAIKKKISYLSYFLLWAVVNILLISLTIETPHPTRNFMLVIPLVVLSAFGLLTIWEYIKKIKYQKLLMLSCLGFAGVFVYGAIYYFTTYFFLFPTNQAPVWRSAELDLIEFLAEHENEYKSIVIDPKTDLAYTSLGFYKRIPPGDYQKTSQYKKDGLLLTASKVGKYEFNEPRWDTFDSTTGTLFVTTVDGYTNKPIYKRFYYPERPVVQATDGIISAYATKDVVYVLIRTAQ